MYVTYNCNKYPWKQKKIETKAILSAARLLTVKKKRPENDIFLIWEA